MDVKNVEQLQQDERTSDTWVRRRVEESVSAGHRTRLIRYPMITRMTTFQMAVAKQQKTTVAILMPNGMKESGAIQRMSISAGKHATSPSVVSPSYYIWPPSRAGYYILTLSSFFLSFFLLLSVSSPILSGAHWISTILAHMWPKCEFRNACPKYRTQNTLKFAICAPSHKFVGLYLLK